MSRTGRPLPLPIVCLSNRGRNRADQHSGHKYRGNPSALDNNDPS